MLFGTGIDVSLGMNENHQQGKQTMQTTIIRQRKNVNAWPHIIAENISIDNPENYAILNYGINVDSITVDNDENIALILLKAID